MNEKTEMREIIDVACVLRSYYSSPSLCLSLIVPLYCSSPASFHCYLSPSFFSPVSPLFLIAPFLSLAPLSCFSLSFLFLSPISISSSYSLRIAYHLQTYPIWMKHPNI